MEVAEVREAALRKLNLVTHRLHTLPVLVLMPHSRCNARCVMCDIWKANAEKRELSREDVAAMMPDVRRLGVQRVVFSGGEPLLHRNLWTLAELLRGAGAKITLLSTGISLERHAAEVVRWCDEVIVSLDGPREVHDEIRGVEGAFDKLAAGVAALRAARAGFPASARSVVQRRNFRHLAALVDAARAIGLDRVSFLPADVGTSAFNRLTPWSEERAGEVAPGPHELDELRAAIEGLISRSGPDFARGFIAETPGKLRRIAAHYASFHGGPMPEPPSCNAPWMSAVVEADGAVRPCFFLPAYGNVHGRSLGEVLGSPEAIEARRRLDVASNRTCARCVCTLNLGLRSVA